ncbi:cryptochrome/photolyase family protein [Solimonas sp. SE-A11]|uniref:cryptochrome/photolyase family protein n=1 Tax=Solimonas sp. SE-A11 TaxID=3054954 RepID=UPI00259C8FF7|nr:cryptochrome/photolyase family protein [Solimonas sp. SE-A11]MDM4771761.1 cryptochrome/photolyase family protein [Solimonas sp. SE-A11]
MRKCRNLVLILGDQLDVHASALDGFDRSRDQVWMAEVREESTHVWSSKQRIALFLSAMRHFADQLRKSGLSLSYGRLDDARGSDTLAVSLGLAIERHRPERLIMTAPGDWRVLQALRAVARDHRLPLEVRDDRHFYLSVREFRRHAESRSQLRMEYFYREMRRRHNVLMRDGAPAGGAWNFDAQNRASFGRVGPEGHPAPPRFEADSITREVIELVLEQFPDHPGTLDEFHWPVTREQSLHALERFIEQRLPDFGRYQDAMWPQEPWLFHSQLSAALNLKLLDPREVVGAAEHAWQSGKVPLPAAEGFIRQILGWREYVRGVYWTQMPEYMDRNALDAREPLPDWYWTGRTEMACLRDALAQTLRHGYAHHIQRLMVTGLYALLLGVEPRALHGWYLSVYVDAVEWVELPNTLGMSQYADGGLMASKPYVASGAYIDRMSPFCRGCRYSPRESEGDGACPFTVLYWDFLIRHQERLRKNPRMAMPLRHLDGFGLARRQAITLKARAIRQTGGQPQG